MKDKIRELLVEAGVINNNFNPLAYEQWYLDSLEKFAESIVKESIMQMAIQMDKFGDNQSNNPIWYKSEEAVKKHFGIRE